MSNKFFICLLISTLLIIPLQTVFSDENSENQHNLTIEAVMQEIRNTQNVTTNKDITPELVSDSLLKDLGEAVMNTQHPDPREHEFMDNMMGGDGSANLKATHQWMGYQYLTQYLDGNSAFRRPGIIEGPGSWMMTNGRWMGNHMNFGFSWFSWLMIILVVGVIISVIMLIINKKTHTNKEDYPALNILKKRLASGEISKEEFYKLKDDVI